MCTCGKRTLNQTNLLVIVVGADGDGAEAAVAGQAVHLARVQARLEREAVHRLEVLGVLVGVGHDVGQVAQERLHGGGGAQRRERHHDLVRVAQPAVAVVVAGVRRVERDRGGGRRHDRARLLERVQRQRDARANHLRLELKRNL